jgi:hypothetical protein
MNKSAKSKDGRKAAGGAQLWLRLPGLVRDALYDTVIGAGLACVDEVLQQTQLPALSRSCPSWSASVLACRRDRAKGATGRQDRGLFRYRDKGRLATVGRAFAIADFGSLRFAGFVAWMLWWTVHILYLAGLWNRLQVLMTWVWAYLTYQRSVRILTPPRASACRTSQASPTRLSRSLPVVPTHP